MQGSKMNKQSHQFLRKLLQSLIGLLEIELGKVTIIFRSTCSRQIADKTQMFTKFLTCLMYIVLPLFQSCQSELFWRKIQPLQNENYKTHELILARTYGAIFWLVNTSLPSTFARTTGCVSDTITPLSCHATQLWCPFYSRQWYVSTNYFSWL